MATPYSKMVAAELHRLAATRAGCHFNSLVHMAARQCSEKVEIKLTRTAAQSKRGVKIAKGASVADAAWYAPALHFEGLARGEAPAAERVAALDALFVALQGRAPRDECSEHVCTRHRRPESRALCGGFL